MPNFFEIAHKRRVAGDVPQNPATAPAATGAPVGQAGQSASLMPPFEPAGTAPRGAAAPGVVPPPAAPIVSMRPPEPTARAASAAATATAAPASRDTQHWAQPTGPERARLAAQRARMAAAAGKDVRSGASQSPAPTLPPATPPQTRRLFDPIAAAQAGMLNLAWRWQEAGSPIRAIHTYMELLMRYPDTPGADAAVADLVELSDLLAQQGQFHTALAIYDHLETLL